MRTAPVKGRGSLSNRGSRFHTYSRESIPDEWEWLTPQPAHESSGDFPAAAATGPMSGPTVRHRPDARPDAPRSDAPRPDAPRSSVTYEQARSIISRNTSPDIPFDQSINAYRGCEHGCIYCYARPTHAYLDLSPGLDFETKLYAKGNAAQLLRQAFDRPQYQPELIAMGTNTDPYQPVERRLRITSALLEVFDEYNHPVSITTKSALITRDIPLLTRLARRNLVRVQLSITTLDRELARRMEPRASSPESRLAAIQALHDAGIPVGVIIAPVIPGLTDHELEHIATAAANAGAIDAFYVLLRLPHEVAELFQEWLQAHYPLKAARVMNLLRSMRGGRDYNADFRQRMGGSGIHADLLRQRFKRICSRHGLGERSINVDCSAFSRPGQSRQLGLF